MGQGDEAGRGWGIQPTAAGAVQVSCTSAPEGGMQEDRLETGSAGDRMSKA